MGSENIETYVVYLKIEVIQSSKFAFQWWITV